MEIDTSAKVIGPCGRKYLGRLEGTKPGAEAGSKLKVMVQAIR